MNKKKKKQYTCKYNKLHIISHFSGYKKAGTTRAVPAPYSDLFFYFLCIKILYATIKNFNKKISDNT